MANLLRYGRRSARTVSDLSRAASLNERTLRQIVRHLIDEHGFAIGSATVPPCGYYLIDDPLELELHCARMTHRGISILQRVSRIKKNSVTEVFHQGVMQYEQNQSQGGRT